MRRGLPCVMNWSMNRRDLMRVAGGGALTMLTGSTGHAADTPGLGPSSGWKKHGELFRYEGSAEKAWVQNFTSTAEPVEGGKWRLWTSISVPGSPIKQIGYHLGEVGGVWRHVPAVCRAGEPDREVELSIGGLPEGWHPVQVVTLRLHDGRTRLYFWAHGEGVVRYLAADSEDGRAFRVANALSPCLYHNADRAVGGEAAVGAGLRRLAKKKAAPVEGEALAPSSLITNDATNVYQLPDGSFEMYTVTLFEVEKDDPRYAPQDNLAGRIRVIDRLTSGDGLQWGYRQRVLEPDADDPSDLQFYYLSVTHTERGRVGLLGHYRLGAQTIDLEPCFSSDGISWSRPLRTPWIQRDAPGETAGSYLLHAPHAMVQRDGLWHLFYTGGNFAHNHKDAHGTPDRAVMLATCATLFV
jgi:hypothetical protein